MFSIVFYNMSVLNMTLHSLTKKLHTAMISSMFCNMSVPSMTLQTIRNNFKTYHFAFCLTAFLRPV